MSRASRFRSFLPQHAPAGLVLVLVLCIIAPAAVTPAPDLHGPDSARTARFPLPARVKADRAGFLGLRVDVDDAGKLVVSAIAPDSPASRAGFHPRDVIERVDAQPVPTSEAFAKVLQSKKPGQEVAVSVRRGNTATDLKATLVSLASVGRPTTRPTPPLTLGFRTGETRPEGGERVTAIDPNSPAVRAGIRTGDFILKVNQTALDASTRLADALALHKPNELVSLSILRDGQEFQIRMPVLGPAQTGPGFGFGRGPTAFKKDVFHIAVVGVEFSDVRHNPQVTPEDWSREFFSKGEYTGRSATGQTVYGSVNDFYQEVSAGAMRVEGTFFDWVQVPKKRMDYYTPPVSFRAAPATRPSPGAGGRARRGGAATYDADLLNDALEQLTSRGGATVLNGFDGLIVLYAGARPVRLNGNVFWPHTSGMVYRGQRLMYCIAEEGGTRMTNISLFCHEIGHMLGLPDLYMQREPGSPPSIDAVGLGNWCLMSIQIGNGRPQHMSAWSKEKLGWIKPAVIDPSVRQHLVLAPIENSSRECFKIPLKTDGSEYLLLENRSRTGFDVSVPGEGLVIWHVVNGRPVLVEATGFTGPRAPTMNVQNIPYPTPRNDEYTPYSRPSSTIDSDDALPVYITHIRRTEGNKIAFDIGYAYN